MALVQVKFFLHRPVRLSNRAGHAIVLNRKANIPVLSTQKFGNLTQKLFLSRISYRIIGQVSIGWTKVSPVNKQKVS